MLDLSIFPHRHLMRWWVPVSLAQQKKSWEILRSWSHWGRRSMQPNVLAHFKGEPGAVSAGITVSEQLQRNGLKDYLRFLFSEYTQKNVFWCLSFRHSRFGGSYVVQGLRSIGENDLIYHRNINNVSSDLLQFKEHLIDFAKKCEHSCFPFQSSKITLTTQERQ